MIEWIFIGLILIILILYGTLLNGYLALDRTNELTQSYSGSVTVLISFKNEEQHLSQLIESLLGQTYNLNCVQFIFVDDHSIDNSADIIKSSLTKFPDAEYQLNKSHGKKQAILTGTSYANYDWILMTDADCIPSSKWIQQMTNSICKNPLFVAGPVQINVPNTWYGDLLKNEHAALQQLTRLSIAKQAPLMANGANMLIKKELVKKAFTPENLNYTSGDDSNLLFAVWEQDSKSIAFVNSSEAVVTTNSPTTLSDSIQQRVRWASKLKKYESLHHVTSVGWIIAIANLVIPILIILLIKGISLGLILIVYILCKTWIDLRFIQNQLNEHSYLKQLISTLLYPFFFGTILIISLLRAPKRSTMHSKKW